MLSIVIAVGSRCLLVLLFLPFSALDKLLNFEAAVAQASLAIHQRQFARIAILTGLSIEILMSMAVVSGVADRAAALVLASYCVATALLWKRFWRTADFRLTGASQGRDVFWDFLKNMALAGGFLMVSFGGSALGVEAFLHDPLASSHPYRYPTVMEPSETRAAH